MVLIYNAVALIWSECQSRIPFPGDMTFVPVGGDLCWAAGFSLCQTFEIVAIGSRVRYSRNGIRRRFYADFYEIKDC